MAVVRGCFSEKEHNDVYIWVWAFIQAKLFSYAENISRY